MEKWSVNMTASMYIDVCIFYSFELFLYVLKVLNNYVRGVSDVSISFYKVLHIELDTNSESYF
jgi:hypothetical protein